MSDLKLRLKKGDLVVGTMISEIRNPNLAYMLAQCGFDFFIIDNEHGSYSPETISNIIAAARGAGVLTIVRIPEIRRETILKPLDCGAAGLLVPQVNTAQQAKEIMTHAKYPPLGNRGVALSRPHSRYARPEADEYLVQANEATFIAVQAESPEAISNLKSIATTPGVDAIFVGPADLSVSLGIPGQISHPDEIEAINKVVDVCQKNGITPGIHMSNLELLKAWIEKGMRFVTFSSDVDLLSRAAADSLTHLKKVIDKT
jgi:2-dehydro-3-deoxyglucarate aldolase/4-hydroxy-2-oxoheptanedioate aldolase